MTTTDAPPSSAIDHPRSERWAKFTPQAVLALFSGRSGRSVALAWIATRGLMLVVLMLLESTVEGDVKYYGRSLHGWLAAGGSLHSTLREYPLPVLTIMAPQYLLGAMNVTAFLVLFAISMLAVDAGFTWLLFRCSGRRRGEAVTFWLLFVPALGPIAMFRFDLIPAVIAGTAILVAVRRPAMTGVLTAIGAALKLWPAAILPVFLIRRIDRRPVLVGFAVTGGLIGAASIVLGGWTRFLSPLDWQSRRGLQIESVAAQPLMLIRSLHHQPWTVKGSAFKATEIFGPGVDTTLTITTMATVAAFALLAWLWLRCRALPAVTTETLGWLLLTTALIVTITNKTLSPQYILWLGGPVGALLVRAPNNTMVRRAAGTLLVLSLLTQLVYPLGYGKLSTTGNLTFAIAVALAVRDGLLVWLTWFAARQVWRQTQQHTGPAVGDPREDSRDGGAPNAPAFR
jgi:Glycosyltransferase family 87